MEYSVFFLNGITMYQMASSFSEAIKLAVEKGKERCFSNLDIKCIMDGEGNVARNININKLSYQLGQEICGIQEQRAIFEG